jgi:hypothetical protein
MQIIRWGIGEEYVSVWLLNINIKWGKNKIKQTKAFQQD